MVRPSRAPLVCAAARFRLRQVGGTAALSGRNCYKVVLTLFWEVRLAYTVDVRLVLSYWLESSSSTLGEYGRSPPEQRSLRRRGGGRRCERGLRGAVAGI